MLRFKILASVVPLMIATAIARGGLLPGPRPCIMVGDASVEIASVPWHADLHVSFTDDPAAATVRVQISDSAEAADFVVVDDVDSAETGSCGATATTLFVAVSATPASPAPVIYLVAGRSGRLPNFRAIEDLYGARRRSPHRRRPRRTPSPHRRIALRSVRPAGSFPTAGLHPEQAS